MRTVLSKILFVTAVTILSLSAFDFVYAETTSSTPEIVITSSTDSGLKNTTTNNSTISLPSVNLTIRYNDEVVFSGNIELTTTTYHDEINNLDYSLTTSTVFSTLVNTDASSTNFAITDDQFNSYYNSFYLRCITFQTSTTTEACDNWQYTVDGQYVGVGMDKKELIGDENIYIYFGDRYKLNTEKTEYTTDETVTSTLQEYDFTNNTWQNKAGQEILLTEPIASDYSNWPPQIFSSSTTNDFGEAYFNQTTTGTYYITLANDYWPSVTITITTTTPTSTENNIIENPTSGGGSSNSTIDHSPTQIQITEAVNKILNYFKTQQNEDGSILDGGTSDWVAMSFGANGQYAKDIKNSISDNSLYDYIYNYNFTDPSEMNLCAAYPRHILALLASGVTKTDNKIVDLKNKITNENCYQNSLYGQTGINDDIFALIVLQNFGFDEGDEEVSKTIDFIISKQSGSGSWEGIDLTAAAIQALVEFDDYDEVSSAVSKAENFIKNRQNPNGGWSNVYSTAWAMMAMSALSHDFDDWRGNPLEYLGELQNEDGGLLKNDSENNRIWSTSYSIASASGKTWIEILNDFSVKNRSDNNGSAESSSPTRSLSTSESADSPDGDLVTSNTNSPDAGDSGASERFIENLDEILAFLDQQELAFNQDEIVAGVEESYVEGDIENSDGVEIIQTNEEIRNQISNNRDNNQEDQEGDDASQIAAVSNALDFSWWVYFLSAIVALSISVIMFKIK